MGSTYSVKYLGITEGKIGILSRRLPMEKPKREKPDRSMAVTFQPAQLRLQRLAPMTVSAFAPARIEDTKEKVVPPMPSKPQEPEKGPEPAPEVKAEPVPEPKEEELQYVNKFSGNIPQYVPIGTSSINDMFASQKYLESLARREREVDLATATPQKETLAAPVVTSSPKPSTEAAAPPKKKKKRVRTKKTNAKLPLAPVAATAPKKDARPPPHPKPKTSSNTTPTLPELSRKPARLGSSTSSSALSGLRPKLRRSVPPPMAKPATPEEKLSHEEEQAEEPDDAMIPHPELYNEHLVHTYSLPKALPVYRRIQVYSEAEQFDHDKYSKESVASAVYPKLAGVRAGKQAGFKGHGLPASELRKARMMLSNSKSRSGLLNMTGYSALPNAGTGAQLEPRVEGCRAPRLERTFGGCGASSKTVTFVLQNALIKEKSLVADAGVAVPTPREPVPLQSEPKRPGQDVNENNRLISMLLDEGDGQEERREGLEKIEEEDGRKVR